MTEKAMQRTSFRQRGLLRPGKARQVLARAANYVILTVSALVFLIPLAWLISTALGTAQDAMRVPHNFFPWPLHLENFPIAFAKAPFNIYIVNTLKVTFFGVTGGLLSTSLVAFGFARMRFRGRDMLFFILLSTMMVPRQVLLVPSFIMFKTFGWYDTHMPLWVPQCFATNAFGVFLLRQFYMSIPLELDEAARLDGASTLRIWFNLLLPLSKPALTTLGVLSFLFNWNNFILPLIYTRSPDNQTFALALAALPGQYYSDYHLLMAITLSFMLPCVLLFFFSQRYLLQGLSLTGVGGK